MVRRRLSGLLLVGGIALLVLAGVVTYPQLALRVETLYVTRRIAKAPVLSTAAALNTAPTVLLPARDAASATATVAATPLTPNPLATSESLQGAPRATPMANPTSSRTVPPTAAWSGTTPMTLSIPGIDLEAPVVAIGWTMTTVSGQSQAIWDVPDERRIGWHNTSAPLGVPGNTVLNGHNTSGGEVFRDLYKVEIGAQISVRGADGEVYVYRVEQKYILREAGQPLPVRLENARYIQEMQDERVTLVTCHPYGSLANRLVLIAFPVTETILDRGGAN